MSDSGEKAGFRAGFVAVVGLPNAGKSTLVNAFFGKPLCIVSPKPQTSRFQVRCVSTNERRQLVLVDTPGWHARGKGLGKFMRREISRALSGVDAAVFIVDAAHPNPGRTYYAHGVSLQGVEAPVVVVLNKIDRIPRDRMAALLDDLYRKLEPKEIVPVSALEGTNLEELDRVLTALMPEGPPLYPPETLVDRSEEFMFAEYIREQLYLATHEEVPFSCAVALETVHRDEKPLRVEAAVLVSRESQKGILIGKEGQMISRIRQLAEKRIGTYLGRRAKVELLIKVDDSWLRDPKRLERLGE